MQQFPPHNRSKYPEFTTLTLNINRNHDGKNKQKKKVLKAC